jgi:hypothetical protein
MPTSRLRQRNARKCEDFRERMSDHHVEYKCVDRKLVDRFNTKTVNKIK